MDPEKESKSGRTLTSKCLDAIIADQLGEPEEISLFGEFEELSKTYSIELPLVGRTRIERFFDVYDGKKLNLSGGTDDEDYEEDQDDEIVRANQLVELDDQHQQTQSHARTRADISRRRRKWRRSNNRSRGGLTWCKLLFDHKAGLVSGKASCCISRSDTSQFNEPSLFAGKYYNFYRSDQHSLDISTTTPLSSLDNIESLLPSFQPVASSGDSSEHEPENEQDIRNEVVKMFGPILKELRRCSGMDGPQGMRQLQLQQQQQQQQQQQPSVLSDVILESSGQVSVCILDKRNRVIKLKEDADCGQRWTIFKGQLDDLKRRLIRKGALGYKFHQMNSSDINFKKEIEREIDKYFCYKFKKVDDICSGRKERLTRAQFDRLIELIKNSLNNLIDTQLLLRNKLNQEQHQQSNNQQTNSNNINNNIKGSNNLHLQTTTTTSNNDGPQFTILNNQSDSYENLLKNNFNLLKIWQNLEETKKLACFVCEPIKANLGDLFQFNKYYRCNLTTNWNCSPADNQLLSSPLVSLDSIQVKKGLIQILEALNYLHLHCKLIHRDVNPRNIFIASNDNWKLGGLQHAVKFESNTISESASIMRFELAGSTLRFSNSKSNLRRQRTLLQIKCEEFLKCPKAGAALLLQPELDYLAPEIFKTAQCSHKSDLFSFGLVLAQTFDIGSHDPPLNCKNDPSNYEQELEKLNEKRKWKILSLVPFELKLVLIEMLEIEPNLRPSANLALQMLRRPIDLCKENDNSLRHLKAALTYLDGASSWWQLNSSLNQANSSMSNQTVNCGHISGSNNSQTTNSTNMGPNNMLKGAIKQAGAQQQSQQQHQQHQRNIQCNLNSDKRSKGRRARYFRKVISAFERNPNRKQARNLQMLNLFWRALDSAASSQPTMDPTAYRSSSPYGPLDGSPSQRSNFTILRQQFELALDTLRQLYKLAKGYSHFAILDSRTLMLLIALHRRQLDHLILMRQELPPMPRLANSNPSSLLSQNYRSLAELEDQFVSLVCRHSMPKLSPALSDPTLKLDEFIILYELVNDLVAFVGLRNRQSFIQRGRQLLNDLISPTGCLSTSSSSDEEEENGNFESVCSMAIVGMSGRDSVNSSNRMRRYTSNELEDTHIIRQQHQQQQQQQLLHQHRLSTQINLNSRQATSKQLATTKISITAPSPMGSMKDVNQVSYNTQTDDHCVSSSLHRQSISNTYQQQRQYQMNMDEQLSDRTRELRLDDDTSDDGRCSRSSDLIGSQSDGQEQNVVDGSGGELDKQKDKSRSQLIDELLSKINDDSFNDIVHLNSKFATMNEQTTSQMGGTGSSINGGGQRNEIIRPKSALDGMNQSRQTTIGQQQAYGALGQSQQRSNNRTNNSRQARQSVSRASQYGPGRSSAQQPSTFDNVIRRMSTNIVQNFNRMSATTLGVNEQHQTSESESSSNRRGSSNYANSLYVDNQVPTRRHSDNTINIPKIQVGLSSPQSHSSRNSLSHRGSSASVSKIANKWKTKTNQKEACDKLSPTLNSALGYMRRHSSGNTTEKEQSQSNGHSSSHLLFSASPFKTKSSSNLGLDFLLSNRSMKRRCSAASMLGHQTQRKAEDLIDAGMKSVQNMFS